MYKRWVIRPSGKRDGPYWYKSVRTGNTIRSVYVGLADTLKHSERPKVGKIKQTNLFWEKPIPQQKMPFGVTPPKTVPMNEVALTGVVGGRFHFGKDVNAPKAQSIWDKSEHHEDIRERLFKEGEITIDPHKNFVKTVDSRFISPSSMHSSFLDNWYYTHDAKPIIGIWPVHKPDGTPMTVAEIFDDPEVFRKIEGSASIWKASGATDDTEIVYGLVADNAPNAEKAIGPRAIGKVKDLKIGGIL